MDKEQTITLAQGKRTGQPIGLTVHAARTIFVSGKRGSGKTSPWAALSRRSTPSAGI